MSNKISRRTFLKCTGASAAAMGAASLLGGCSSNGNNTSVEVKVGDKISNWNNLLVSFTGLFRMNLELGIEGYEAIALLAVVKNLTRDTTYAIGAQNVLELNETYPIPPESNFLPYLHELAAATTDFSVSCDGQSVEAGAYISLYDEQADTFSDSPNLPPQRAGYIEMVCLVPKGWKEMDVTFMPTFVEDRTITFRMSVSDLTTGE